MLWPWFTSTQHLCEFFVYIFLWLNFFRSWSRFWSLSRSSRYFTRSQFLVRFILHHANHVGNWQCGKLISVTQFYLFNFSPKCIPPNPQMNKVIKLNFTYVLDGRFGMCHHRNHWWIQNLFQKKETWSWVFHVFHCAHILSHRHHKYHKGKPSQRSHLNWHAMLHKPFDLCRITFITVSITLSTSLHYANLMCTDIQVWKSN